MKHTRFVGLDIHKERISIAVAQADALGRWNTSARLPMILVQSASCVTVSGAPASRWRFVMRPDRAVMVFIANSQASAIGVTWWRHR